MPGTRFDPRLHGFHFANQFTNTVNVAGVTVTTRGRCGGMAYAVLDALAAGQAITQRADRPSDADPLGRFLWERQVQSLQDMVPAFVEKTAAPHESDADRFRWATTTYRGDGSLEQFGKLRAFVDRDEPVVLGLISTKTGLDVHHQVVGVGFENFNERPDGVRVRIWDPNHPKQIVTLVPDVATNSFFTTHDGDTRWRSFFVYERAARAAPPPELLAGGFVADVSVPEVIFALRAPRGEGAVGQLQRPRGQWATTQSLAGFSPAWTLAVGTRQGVLFLHHAPSGTAALCRMDGGRYVFIRTFSLPGGFDRATAVGEDLVFLLDASAGRGVVLQPRADGSCATRLDAPGFSPGWTHVTGARGGGVLFYQAGTGVAATAHVDAAGAYRFVGGLPQMSAGWTHIVAAGDELLFYRKGDGALACARLDASGGYHPVRDLHGHYPGWTHLVASPDGSVLFYASDSGAACTGWLRDGCYASLFHPTNVGLGWTHLCSVGFSAEVRAPAPALDPVDVGRAPSAATVDEPRLSDLTARRPRAQRGWDFCTRCSGLFFAAGRGRCCAGGDAHAGYGSNYGVQVEPAQGSQDGWRFCARCACLVHTGSGAPGCPAGGAHDLSLSGAYFVRHGAPAEGMQDGWRYCTECSSLVHLSGGGQCVSGGSHDLSASGAYFVTQ